MSAAHVTTLIAVAAGGVLGAVARYAVSLWVVALIPRFPPAGTLIVNVAGCVLIGTLMVLAEHARISETARQLWVTGFAGSLTTFSTFAFQTIELAREERYGLAAVNVLANSVVGFAAVLAGFWIARRIIGS
jgi:CrcB protein